MPAETLISNLKDIHLPEQVSWWPLAPGWWLMFVVLLIFIFCIWWLIQKRKQKQLSRNSVIRLAQLEAQFFEHNNDRELVLGLSVWLRQVCLAGFPDQKIAGLTGQRWLEFLDDSGATSGFSCGEGRVFGAEIYNVNVSVDGAQLLALCKTWLDSVRPRLIKQARH